MFAMGPGFFRAANAPSSVTDPYWSNVVALLHLDGTAGSTLITDEVDGTSWVVHGDAHVSDSTTLFGGNCFAFDGAGDFLSTPYSAKYDISADFTIEAFVNPTSVAAGTYYSVCSKRQVSTAGWSFEVGNNVASG